MPYHLAPLALERLYGELKTIVKRERPRTDA
jgi:hypothetical protein